MSLPTRRDPPPPSKPVEEKVKRRQVFPRTIQWQQGSIIFRRDLVTGRQKISIAEIPHYGRLADTFKVTSVSEINPRRNRIDMGGIDAIVSATGVRFVQDDGVGVRQRRVRQRNTYGRSRSGGF